MNDYRDSNIQKLEHGKVAVDELNDKYNNLIKQASSKADFDFFDGFMGHMTKSKIQKQLVEIYDYLTGYVKGKGGLLKNSLLGKTVDLNMVISHLNVCQYLN